MDSADVVAYWITSGRQGMRGVKSSTAETPSHHQDLACIMPLESERGIDPRRPSSNPLTEEDAPFELLGPVPQRPPAVVVGPHHLQPRGDHPPLDHLVEARVEIEGVPPVSDAPRFPLPPLVQVRGVPVAPAQQAALVDEDVPGREERLTRRDGGESESERAACGRW